jgi:hypothetical protein
LTNIVRTTVGITASIYNQIDALARVRGVTRATVIRAAIEAFIARNNAATDGFETANLNLPRIALLCEFSQASADVLLRELAPDKRAQVLQTVTERMEHYHGQK